MEIAELIGAVGLWGIVHSWLASDKFKTFVRRAAGDGKWRAYRLAYNIFAVLSFIPVLALMRTRSDDVVYSIGAPGLFVLLGGQAVSAACLLAALFQTDVLHFSGLRQLTGGEAPARLITAGFYSWVRHPLYLFGLLILWLSPIMTRNTLVVWCALTVYILVGAMFEERRLRREYGMAYTDYASKTPMLIPGLRVMRPERGQAKGPGSPTAPDS